jgi:hypothetical protein
MKTIHSFLVIIFLIVPIWKVFSQSKFQLEMGTGPLYSYQSLSNDPNPSMDFSTPIGMHFGLGFLYRIQKDWQILLQSEFSTTPYRYTINPEYFTQNRPEGPRRVGGYGSLGHYRVGVRKVWEKGDYAWYIQPTMGLNLAREAIYNFQNSGWGVPPITYRTNIVGSASLEGGIKFYTKSKNYFVVGLRHQMGFRELRSLDLIGSPLNPQPAITTNGSYTGVVLGYGIDFRGRTKESKDEQRQARKERKAEKRDLAWGDGAYVAVTGLLRFSPRYERQPNLEFSHISGGNEFLAGYTFGPWSVESGFSRWNAYTRTSSPNFKNENVAEHNTRAIPLRVRYHYDIGVKQRLRVGASLSTFLITNTVGMGQRQLGRYEIENTEMRLLTAVPADHDSQGKLFFQAGVFAEVPIFNSSLFTLNFSRNFGSPEIGRVDVTEQYQGQEIKFQESGSLNGYIVQVGFKLPIVTLLK